MSPLLVFGRTGQVARELQDRAPGARYLGRDEADLADPAACAEAIRILAPVAVINAAAWTAVDRAETEEAAATTVNGAAPAAMARACAGAGIPFVHLSTDYVFDGTGDAPFTPDHPTGPLGAYGRSKLSGERGVLAAGGTTAILRTSWVVSRHGTNFVKTMLRLGAERDELRVVADQIGGPTPAGAIAEACLSIVAQLRADPAKAGVYHLSGLPDISWAGLAAQIMLDGGLDCRITQIPSTAYPTPAPRPLNSRLDCQSLTNTFGIDRPRWREALPGMIAAIRETTQ